MVSFNAIESLRRGVEKVGDADLKSELLAILTEVQRDLTTTREYLFSQRDEIENLKTQAGLTYQRAARAATYVYDPPV